MVRAKARAQELPHMPNCWSDVGIPRQPKMDRVSPTHNSNVDDRPGMVCCDGRTPKGV